MDQGVFSRWGIDAAQFEAAIHAHPDDEGIRGWLKATVSPEKIDAANRWLRDEKHENLDRQDREEAG